MKNAAIVTALFALLAASPAFAASDSVERNVDRVNQQQDAKQDNQQSANPCKGITKSSTRKQKQACATFMSSQ